MEQQNIPTLFNESFERCLNDINFLDKFYEIFLSSSDEVCQMFKGTDMEVQKAILVTSLVYMSRAYNDDDPDLLLKIAEKHDKNNLNIKAHFYWLWLNSLIEAAYFIDPLFDEKTEKLWKEVLQPGIDLMISHYRPDLNVDSYPPL